MGICIFPYSLWTLQRIKLAINRNHHLYFVCSNYIDVCPLVSTTHRTGSLSAPIVSAHQLPRETLTGWVGCVGSCWDSCLTLIVGVIRVNGHWPDYSILFVGTTLAAIVEFRFWNNGIAIRRSSCRRCRKSIKSEEKWNHPTSLNAIPHNQQISNSPI